MSAILLFGFLLGIRHALEADHVAAVATLAARNGRLRDTVRVAVSWSVGHAATLIILGSLLLALGTTLSDGWARLFEGIVGLVLVGLGADVLRRLWKKRIHAHVHVHDDEKVHVHVHVHEPHAPHDETAHHHQHARGLLGRSVAVGGLHGLAGSGALVLLSLNEAGSPLRALAYLVLFALGSIGGMVAFSIAISLPLRSSSRWLGWTTGGLEAVLGLTSVCLGFWIALRSAVF